MSENRRTRALHRHPDTPAAQMLARAQKLTPIAAVQNRYNLLDRSGVQVLADCEAQGIMFVPYFPLASGQLTSYDELTALAGESIAVLGSRL